MSICQKLYQNGDITYMRTENTKYSTLFLEQARAFILKEWEHPGYVGTMEKLESNDKINPHEAIRVTHIERKSVVGFDARTSSLYRLIWRNTVESCMSDAVYNVIPCHIAAAMDYTYKYTLEIPLFLGWKKVGITRTEEKEDETFRIPTIEDSALHLFFQSIQPSVMVTYQYIDSTVTAQHLQHHYTEASLIQKLEELGIGRPSTFSFIVETIQERGYVKKQDIPGKQVECIEYKMRDSTIETIRKEKVFGNEKNKLLIQPTGIMTIEFLLQYFQTLFSYDYTKKMEERLDKIGSGEDKEIDGSVVCRECYEEIKTFSKPIAQLSKQTYRINEEYELVFQKNGCSLRRKTENGSYEYKPVKQSIQIDVDRLKQGKYSYEDLVEIQNDYLGEYEGMDMYMKIGKYGPYVEWGEHRENIQSILKPLNEITLFDIQEHISSKKQASTVPEDKRYPPEAPKSKNTVRVLNMDLSIRKGTHGIYIFYQTKEMKKPVFFPIKQFQGDCLKTEASTVIEWIKKTYSIK